ncbi:DUF1330 domain-containing protein [Burkholderia vietnamiensis]|uniref:DUF1330 domain-containing protein n=1 Tax=Burkholderia vietnamiensis TaxID=60552 RepID=UPI000759CC4B|nr:DUF1330 domain-containing protein [Burkholderia vietnamiensis]KVR79779.1 hypothetical protein WK26_15655 [Burkholderia vietnamiensis]KVS46946.1 hypothetical protein WK35_19810 [Burkholderia vietnamiensis]MBR8151794.1 DUF1330 domain-containing protein [Burkholderia vietnamiensis]QTK88785.1 DUF1330 domain-containing protein [Burkholderia vietnamiensis]HDR9318915.1 DUF1330 domain-containing protein [Burkholderia vietnamiensis]
MSHTEYTRAALEAASPALGDKEPVYMVNLVRYRADADYGGNTKLPACSGREAYFQRYAPAFKQVAASEDYAVFWVGNVRGVLVGTDSEAWDDIVIVRYSSFTGLRRILESPAYEKDAAPHRRAALADWKFVITTQPDLPK